MNWHQTPEILAVSNSLIERRTRRDFHTGLRRIRSRAEDLYIYIPGRPGMTGSVDDLGDTETGVGRCIVQ